MGISATEINPNVLAAQPTPKSLYTARVSKVKSFKVKKPHTLSNEKREAGREKIAHDTGGCYGGRTKQRFVHVEQVQ